MGLGAQWREGLLAQKVLEGKTKGWKNHPQMDRFKYHPRPLDAIGYYLKEIHNESLLRGYRYIYTKILNSDAIVDPIPISLGQIEYEFMILQERLKVRNPEKYNENIGLSNPAAHPMFKIVPGLPEKWEKAYWREKDD